MTLLPGEEIGKNRNPDDRIGGQRVADSYWRARADLHRAGIAHNDMHMSNVIVDGQGKSRFIDFGMSQNNIKAALSEALGAFSRNPETGDWHTKIWKGNGGGILQKLLEKSNSVNASTFDKAPVLGRVWDNYGKVLARMRKDGFSDFEISLVVDNGIQRTSGSYETGVWKKMPDFLAEKYIEMLYEGV